MQDFYHQVGPCGLAIIILGLGAVYMAVRGLVLSALIKKQAPLPHSVLQGIVEQAQATKSEDRALVINALMQHKLKGIYGAMYFLKLCAALGPLLGLLGTVLGMVEVFATIAERSYPEPSLLAGGIWQALITTVMGLSLAIPALLLHYVLLLTLRRIRAALNLQAAGIKQD
ncbi:MAG: MotA/TolQ/ExbB proton channel family protein [Candidatus Anaerobiospirillum merdipullorum]|uniref:MotA/TolQ/ExbB proton channel family protein n=1 Tax=Candidatus Anaerobiospirillum merdipullorum TaxID=2838450 RepID=A0A9E2KNG7_9GAMM|nr:MotA/TolQ/ExbB proton channel family protein [Candidatus Anaerobiospirillum merdipullorum]